MNTITNVLLRPQPTGQLAAWLTASTQVVVNAMDKERLRVAKLVLTALRFVPGGTGNINKILNYRFVDQTVRKIAVNLFSRGYWTPRMVPLGHGGVGGHEEVERKAISRMVMLEYLPTINAFACVDFENGFISPRTINQDSCTADNIKALRDDFKHMPRFDAGTGLTIGRPLYCTVGGRLKSSWVKQNSIPLEAPVNAFLKPPATEMYRKFQFRDVSKVLHVGEPRKLHPEVRVQPEDFPATLHKADPWFFG